MNKAKKIADWMQFDIRASCEFNDGGMEEGEKDN